MRKSNFFTAQANRTANEVMRESGNPVGAIFVAMFTAAFNCGLVHPMHIILTGCDGQCTKATRTDTDLTFERVVQVLTCPLRAVVTDDAGQQQAPGRRQRRGRSRGDRERHARFAASRQAEHELTSGTYLETRIGKSTELTGRPRPK